MDNASHRPPYHAASVPIHAYADQRVTILWRLANGTTYTETRICPVKLVEEPASKPEPAPELELLRA